MANWNTLKTAVADIINTNGNQAITGQLLQNVLNNIITNVGENATFAGIATLDTNPGAPDGPVFYLATTAGAYPNFNGIEVQDGEAVILLWNNNAWSKKVTGFATQEKLSQLGSESVNKILSWSIGFGLNYNNPDLIMDIKEPSWCQSNMMNVQLIQGIKNISKSDDFSIFAICFDDTIDVNSNKVLEGHWAALIKNSLGNQDFTELLRGLSFKPSYCRFWIKKNSGEITEEDTDNFKIVYSNQSDFAKKSELPEAIKWKTSILNPSWENYGLNNTGEHLVYNIKSGVWLQSDWIDARMLESVSVGSSEYMMYIAFADNKFISEGNTIPNGHYIVYSSINTLKDISKIMSKVTAFNPIFAKIWIKKVDSGIITPSDIDNAEFDVKYCILRTDEISPSIIADKTIIKGEPANFVEILDSYLSKSGNAISHESYKTKVYHVKEGEVYRIVGSTMGTQNVACFGLFYDTEIASTSLHSTYTIGEHIGESFNGAKTANIDICIQVPKDVVAIATCYSIYDKEELLLYNVIGTKDYIDKIIKKTLYIDCLGDSLTMGHKNFGWYENTLQELLGESYEVRNWGVGGESSASIMARQGSDCIKFQEDWILKADGSPTKVMDTFDNSLIIKTQAYNQKVSLLLQGASNDSGQKYRVVNPCYINGVQCTMTYTQDSSLGVGKWYISRNNIGDRDITIPSNTPVYFNTGKEMGKSEISIIWMGTNDGIYSDWQTLVDKQIMATNKVSNKKFIVIGLHNIGKTNGEAYESLMRKTFGNKFFNIREYMCTNMIYDAGITPTSSDLAAMENGDCPQSLLYDGTHLKPESNVALGKMLYSLCNELGYI